MAITQLEAVSLWDTPPNVTGAVCYGYLDQVQSWELTRRLDAAHAATVVAPIEGNAAALAVERRILALHFAPLTPGTAGEVYVLRISETKRTQEPGGLTIAITARSLLFDWGDAGPLSYVYAGGFHEFVVTAELTAADWMAQYALPHLQRQGYDWYAFSCANALKIPRAFTRETPLQLLNACQETLDYEVQLAPSGTTWLVSLVPQVNEALSPLRVTVGRNLRRITQARSSQEQASVLVPFGGKGHSEASRSMQGLVFQSVNTDVPAGEFDAQALTDSNWAFPVVAMDGQYVDPTGQRTWYVQRLKTGRCFPIVASIGDAGATTTGRITVAGLTAVTDGSLWALRDGRTPGTELDVPSPGYPLEVSGAPAGNVVTLANPFSAADSVAVDDEHVDCKVRPSTLVLATTSSSVAAVAGLASDVDVTVASTAGVQVGDWGFAHTNAAKPWALYQKVFTVVQVISATVVRVRKRYSYDTTAAPFSVGAMVKQVRFYRASTTYLGFVDDESAAANTITLDTAVGITAGDLLEYAVENSGATLTGLPSQEVATYGVARKDKDFASARCVPNLLALGNPVFDVWVGAIPDRWSFSGIGYPVAVVQKVTTNLPGPGTVYAAELTGAYNQILTSPTFWVRPTAGNSKISVRVRLRTGSGPGWVDTYGHSTQVSVVVPGVGGATLGTAVILPQTVAANTVVDVDLLAVDLLHTPGAGAPYAPWTGVQVKISALNDGGVVTVGGVFVTHDSTLPDDGFMSALGNQDLVGLGQLALMDLDAPAVSNDVEAFDLTRALTEGYAAEELLEGRSVIVEAEALGLAFEERLAAVTFRGAEDGTTQVQVATRTTLFADVLANYLTTGA